jgi:hypothetical protein
MNTVRGSLLPLLPLSLTLTMRSTAAFVPSLGAGRAALLAVPMRRGLHAPLLPACRRTTARARTVKEETIFHKSSAWWLYIGNVQGH